MTGVTTTTTAAILKTLYPQSRVDNLVYKNHPLYAMVPKMEAFYGANLVLAVRYADSLGRSATFATAQTNAGAFASKKFTLTRVSDYQVCQLTSEAIESAENDKGALVDALDVELESGFDNISRSLAQSLYGTGSGSIGRVGTFTSTVITLKNPDDVAKFEVGHRIVASSADTTGSRNSAAVMPITAVDRDAGTLTCDTSLVAALQNDDYLQLEGDWNAKVSGLAAWIPATAPTSATFFGMDRSVDVTRLGGLRIDCTGLNPEEAAVTVLSKQAREGGSPSHQFTNHKDFRGIEISIGSKVEYETASVGEIGFTGLKIIGPKGPVMLVADQDCDSGKMYSLQLNTWKLYSLKKAPRIFDRDGNKLSRVYNADSWEARIGYFAQLGCTAPGYNANVIMPA